eukprot:CAMPEP_0168338616 /NCGR_PEP_ID=MMETSP0213-20121227/12952_1 /TAXON_ID=151035 /ORGANISM="Euplotes harpa, Strain FSP1.4" /LENGTH=346 /DNA_ID=CAMNT_0008344451 /DNA_START=298 /DNA_END=1338 /DNA_ORIENTATION=+
MTRSVFKSEVKILKKLKHPNILKLYDYNYKFASVGGEANSVTYISLEYAENGSLFNYLAKGGNLTDKMARHFFHQLISALEYLHQKGYAHRDVKLENLLLDSNFDLKLADFGLASKSKSSTSKKGTISYMCPEILSGDKYNTCASDLYASAIVLFIILTKNLPFLRAESTDRSYSRILANDWTEFWKIHSSYNSSDFEISDAFKDLFCKMVAIDPEERLTIKQIKNHEWFLGPLPSQEEIALYFAEKQQANKSLVKPVKQSERRTSLKNPAKSQKLKAVSDKQNTRYYKVGNADILMDKIIEFAKKNHYRFKKCPDYFRVILQIEEISKSTFIQMNVLKKPKEDVR